VSRSGRAVDATGHRTERAQDAPGNAERFRGLRVTEGALRRSLQLGLYPAAFVIFVGGGSLLFDRVDGNAVALSVYLVTIPIFFLLERMIPWSERWIGSRGDVHADVGLVAAAGATGTLIEPITRVTAIPLGAWLASHVGVSLWPGDWPLLAQGALAIVVGDFFRYWVHRAMHEWPPLWRVHATHHSATRLYFFNGARIHPFEVVLTGVIEIIPMIALGVPAAAMAMRMLIGRVIGRFQHCNLDVELGPLDYVFSSPKNHRWHHSRHLDEAAHNYGGDLVLWDHVFGSFYLPRDREPSDAIGIENMPDFPRRLGDVLLTPFTWRRFLAPRNPA
jgi:sterol desaturase/sphingolipid hydroxylase (fatty acid hydroxylase superfamily)